MADSNNTRGFLRHLWRSLKSRCSPRAADSDYYANRGISVCREWTESFEAFYGWAIKTGYSRGLTLDRKDGTRPYSPDNCRWATRRQQRQNIRKHKNGRVPFKGVCERDGRYRARIGIKGRQIHIGFFDSAEAAARAYDELALSNFGEFAKLNFSD